MSKKIGNYKLIFMYKLISQTFSLIKKDNIKYTIIVLIASQLTSFLEIIGLSIIPILAINLIDRGRIINFFDEKNLSFLNEIINYDNFILLSFIFLGIFFLFKNIYLIFISYIQSKLRIKIYNDLSNNFFKLFINSSYNYFLKKNPSKIISNMTNDIAAVCSGVFDQIIILFNNIILVIFIAVVLILIDYKLSIFLIFSSLILTFIFQGLIKKFVEEKGKILQGTRADNVKLINQSFDIIKDAKILKKENYFINKFKSQLDLMGKIKVSNAILIALPRPILETAIIIVIISIVFYSTLFDKDFSTTIPYITFLAVSSVRLLPALKVISNSLSLINFSKVSVGVVTDELNEMTKDMDKNKIEIKNNYETNFSENFDKIDIKNVSFSYPKKENVLSNVSFDIKKGEKIGIVGPSGAGKSTLINIFLGILKPSNGKVTIDGVNIFDNLSQWYDLIGLIPQDVYLLHETIKNNIALGEDKLDKNKTEKINDAILGSNSQDFITKLPNGIETNVGNRGISFSGGQKQRIGIARALYHEPKILIMDEATNSLDKLNESEILTNILNNKNLTVLAISHNLKSLSGFDKIIEMEDGNIKKIGNYSDIDNIN